MQEKKVNIELLPEGAFIVTLNEGQHIKGRFSMYALDRFAESKGIGSYLEIVGKIALGMKLREYGELIVFALEDYYRKDFEQCCVTINGEKKRWTWDLVLDEIIDPMGGAGQVEVLQFFQHAVGRLTQVIEEPADDKKKVTKTRKKN